MTESQKITLCELYNMSDIDALEYLRDFCEGAMLDTLERLIYLNLNTTLGYGSRLLTSEEFDYYYSKKWGLLSYFGISNIEGDAYYNGIMY